MIRIYTDGAAQGNPGPGGYGTILKFNQAEKELSEGFRLTTNNRMELLAVIKGLEAIKKEGIPVTIYSDSKYVVEAVELKDVDAGYDPARITIFKSLGIAVQDAAAAAYVYEQAVRKSMGQPLPQ